MLHPETEHKEERKELERKLEKSEEGFLKYWKCAQSVSETEFWWWEVQIGKVREGMGNEKWRIYKMK